jgi:hypothetical protein
MSKSPRHARACRRLAGPGAAEVAHPRGRGRRPHWRSPLVGGDQYLPGSLSSAIPPAPEAPALCGEQSAGLRCRSRHAQIVTRKCRFYAKASSVSLCPVASSRLLIVRPPGHTRQRFPLNLQTVVLPSPVSSWIRALAEALGHHDPGFTLRIYTHLMPAAADKIRAAADSVLSTAAGPRSRPGHRPGGAEMSVLPGQAWCPIIRRSRARTRAGAGAAGSGRSRWTV